VKAVGGKLKDVYLVTGEYDLSVITEAPSDEVVARLSLATAMQGNVRTVTSRAFTRERDHSEHGRPPVTAPRRRARRPPGRGGTGHTAPVARRYAVRSSRRSPSLKVTVSL
jgi:GYD domain-containing protein